MTYIVGGLAALVVAVTASLVFLTPDLFRVLAGSDVLWLGATTSLPSDKTQEREEPSATGEGSREERGERGRPYEPTSEYIADGFDPDKRVLDFQKSGESKRRKKPRVNVLTADDVQRIVYGRANRLIGCYQKILDTRPEAAGMVSFEFAIAPDGEVLMVRVWDSKLESKTAEDCMVRKLKDWDFPATKLEVPTRFKTGMMFRLKR